jgi:hypothetical protein
MMPEADVQPLHPQRPIFAGLAGALLHLEWNSMLEGGPMAWTVSEERSIYVHHRHREVRCRLWYEVTTLREGLLRYFLLRIEELE